MPPEAFVPRDAPQYHFHHRPPHHSMRNDPVLHAWSEAVHLKKDGLMVQNGSDSTRNITAAVAE